MAPYICKNLESYEHENELLAHTKARNFLGS